MDDPLVKNKSELLPVTTRLTKGVVGGVPMNTKVAKLLKGETDQEIAEKLLNEYGHTQANSQEHVTLSSPVESYGLRQEQSLRRILAKPMHQVMMSELRSCFRDEYGWPYFDAVFMISALHGEGVEDLRRFLIERSQEGNWQFHSSVLTNQPPVTVCLNIVRSKLLDELPQEIPYNLKFKLMVWEIDEHDVLCIRLDVICEKERLVRRIVGRDGKIINKVAWEANQELRNLFQRDVFLKLGVTSAENKLNKK